NTDADGPKNVSHRVVADHLRSAGFLIADGVLPSNEGRGYVLRRIMRRAMRHLHQLGCDDPVMFQLVPALVREMGGHYPELVRAQPLISETLKLEEARFKEALARGLKILTAEVEGKVSGGTLSGETAFKLYDTYGFPLDLTEDFMRGYDWQVDIAGFDSAMKAQKEAARAAWSGSGSKADEGILFELADRHGATEFLGYSRLSSEAVVNAIVKDGAEVSHLGVGESGLLVTNQTPFYGESGGQMGDTGLVQSGEVLGHVTDTQKTAAGLFLHHVTVDKGQFETDMPVSFVVDEARRTSLCANHSATHLLHEALRIVLGEHVAQKGSLVAPDRVRFDFSHSIAMSAAEISAVEDIVNARIRMNSDVSTRLMTPDEAVKEGALALFGEKYGDEVRVVSMGGVSDISGKSAWSVELCGGIHVAHTGDIALLKVISESAVAGGVRRIEAVTHAYGLAYLAGRDATLSRAAQILKASPDQLEGRLEQLLDDRRKMEREISSLRQKLATGGADDNDSEMLGNISYRGKVLDDTPARELKAMADAMRSNASGTVICLVATDAGKASIVVSVTDDLIGQMDAVALVKAGSAALGGAGGGGRADMAQAGGPNANAAADAVDAVRQAVLAAG
ncbi:alanine--tRNA ligase, partial [Alphaproteobacteria bacterium]|nr:alanine--tRNA ligase [Alphaproteobacteria bacterium]